MGARITTWADGYGLWHARLHRSFGTRELARQAIIAELAVREGPNFDPNTIDVKRTGAINGWVSYVECDPRQQTGDSK